MAPRNRFLTIRPHPTSMSFSPAAPRSRSIGSQGREKPVLHDALPGEKPVPAGACPARNRFQQVPCESEKPVSAGASTKARNRFLQVRQEPNGSHARVDLPFEEPVSRT